MKLHTSLTEDEVRECLTNAQDGGLVARDVIFAVLGPAGSRSHSHAYKIHLATNERLDLGDVKRKASSLAGSTGVKWGATWDEYGEFLAEFFAADETAKAGPYKSPADFHRQTRYAFATHGELPEDEQTIANREAEDAAEAARSYPDTRPVSNATCDVIGRIDDALGCWSNSLHP